MVAIGDDPGVADLVLEVVEGPGAGTRMPLTGPIELGRAPKHGHSLPDEQISRRHARVDPDAGGAVISDLGSTNGTYVNDQPIAAARRLVSGDQIRMGLTVLELRGSAELMAGRTARRPAPEVTRVGQEVLRPVALEDLPAAPAAASVASLMTDEVEPAFVPRGLVEDVFLPAGRGPLARLADGQVKHRASTAAVALLTASALSVILYYVLL